MAGPLDVVKRLDECFNKHDLAAAAACYTADAVFRAPGGVEARGGPAIADYFKIWLDAFPDMRIDSTDHVVSGSTVVEVGTVSGTHTGVFRTPMGDVPPTGKRLVGNYIDVFTIEGDLLKSDYLMFDRLETMEQLGLVPAQASA
jgi:hypothetical protein